MITALPTAPPQTGLYPGLLGPQWSELHPTVRRMHATGEPLTRTGTFRVRRGTNVIAKILQLVIGLPKESAASAVTLTIEPDESCERWFRRIGDVEFNTIQAPASDNRLRERIGIVDLYFKLHVADGGLQYQPDSAKLALGLISIPLPRWFAPHLVASEAPRGDGAVDVSVQVMLPLIGLLISYEGTLSAEPSL